MKYPSDWSMEGVCVIEGMWRPQPNDACDMYVNGNKVRAVVQAFDGKTITFNYIRRSVTGEREVVVVTQTVRFGR